MVHRYLLPIVLSATFLGCGDKKSDSSAASESKSEDKKKDKKDGDDKKKPDEKSAKPKSDGTATAAVKDEPSAAPSAAVSATPAAPPPSGLASLFTGDVDPSIKFERQAQIPNKPVWMQIVPYWKINLDTPLVDEPGPYTYLSAEGKDGHASISIKLQKPSASSSPTDLSNDCFNAHVPDCKFDAAIDGVIGQGIKVKIAEGTGTMSTKPAKVWWMVGDIEGGQQIVVFAGLRTDVYPKLEAEMKAMIQSIKVQHG